MTILFDSDEPGELFFLLPDRVYVTVELLCWVRFREFWAPAKDAASSGTLTSDSGGGSTTPSGGGSTTGSSVPSHTHVWGNWMSDTPGTYTKRKLQDQNAIAFNLEVASASSMVTSDITINHSHTTPNHTHSTPDHQHTVPGHTHALTYGLFREAMPGSVNVTLKVYRRALSGGSWDLVGTLTGITETERLIDLADVVSVSEWPGLWRLTFQSAAGQPNGGRLCVDVAGYGLGAIRSA